MPENKEPRDENQVEDLENENQAHDGHETEGSPAEDNDQVAALEAELAESEDRILRLQAEIQNLQRRNRLDREDAAKYASQSLATKLLPVIDNLERALTIEVDDEKGNNLKQGLEMVLKSFYEVLDQENIEILNPVDEAFDPNYHEAVAMVEGEEGQESGTVAEVYEKGYVLNDRVLRAAKVTVVG